MFFKRHAFYFALQEKNSWNSYFLNFSSIFSFPSWSESFAYNFPTLPFVSIVILSFVVLFLEFLCGMRSVFI